VVSDTSLTYRAGQPEFRVRTALCPRRLGACRRRLELGFHFIVAITTCSQPPAASPQLRRKSNGYISCRVTRCSALQRTLKAATAAVGGGRLETQGQLCATQSRPAAEGRAQVSTSNQRRHRHTQHSAQGHNSHTVILDGVEVDAEVDLFSHRSKPASRAPVSPGLLRPFSLLPTPHAAPPAPAAPAVRVCESLSVFNAARDRPQAPPPPPLQRKRTSAAQQKSGSGSDDVIRLMTSPQAGVEAAESALEDGDGRLEGSHRASEADMLLLVCTEKD